MNSPVDFDRARSASPTRPMSASRHSKSPSRLRSDVNSFQEHPDPVIRSATQKLADACNRFDRARDGMFLKVKHAMTLFLSVIFFRHSKAQRWTKIC
jgi:hypothetical protein